MENNSTRFDTWRMIICAANDAFENEQTFSALVQYRRAISIAIELVQNGENHRDAYAALLVSYHNMADLYIRDNALEPAKNTHKELFRFIQQKLLATEMQNNEALFWAERTHYQAVMAFSKHHPKFSLAELAQNPSWLVQNKHENQVNKET